ncbi:hypothetical protein [Methanobacterium sp. ACI-7]|uniref:hypothetical protein n=1 Tax=unclassified Methanobacterium TaxID=2627676 RepID=UPI0039C30663
MSGLGSISTKIQMESEIISEFNDALLIYEVELSGKRSEFSFSQEDVNRSKEFIGDFSKSLCLAIKQEKISPSLNSLVLQIENGNKPIDSWIHDLEKLINEINTHPEENNLEILEDIFSLLDNQFNNDLQYLYGR